MEMMIQVTVIVLIIYTKHTRTQYTYELFIENLIEPNSFFIQLKIKNISSRMNEGPSHEYFSLLRTSIPITLVSSGKEHSRL